MKASLLIVVNTALSICCLAGCAARPGNDFSAEAANKRNLAPKKTMRAFRSDKELAGYLRELAEKEKQEQRASAALMLAPPAKDSLNSFAAAAESVTNV